jgi:hypothetical protein
MYIYDWDEKKYEIVIDCCVEEISKCMDVVMKEREIVEEEMEGREKRVVLGRLERVMKGLELVDSYWCNDMREMCWGKKEDWKGDSDE